MQLRAAADRAGPGSVLARVPRPLVDAGAIVVLAALIALFFGRAYVGYDTLYALAWGHELIEGRVPQLDLPNAPTHHPLGAVFGAVVSPAGPGAAYDLTLLAIVLSFAALVWSVFRLGEATLSAKAGALGALVVLTSFTFLARAGASFFDIPYLAIVLSAAVLEARRPRRGYPVLALLAVAGLLRPEAWLLAGAYWLYLAPRLPWAARLWTLGLVLLAPVLWGLGDLALIGDPLRSFHHTCDPSRELRAVLGENAGGGAASAPRPVLPALADYLRNILRLPALAGGLAGLALGLTLTLRRAVLPVALLALGAGAFLLEGAAGLYVLDRFAFLPAAMLALFCGHAAFGWIDRPPGRMRLAWGAGGILVLLALLASVPAQVRRLADLRAGIETRARIADDLAALAQSEPPADCSRIFVQTPRTVPGLAYSLGRRPQSIDLPPRRPPTQGAFVMARTGVVEEQFLLHSADDDPLPGADAFPGFRPAGGDASWAILRRGC